MSTTRIFLLIALVVAGALSIVSCDDAGSPAAPPASPPPPPEPPPPEPPATPTGLHVSGTTVDSITWTWNAVEDATGYGVQVSSDEMFDDTDRIHVVLETSFTATPLQPATSVSVRVAAVRGSLEAPLVSAWTTHVTGMSAMEPPPPPVNLKATPGNRTVVLTWQSPGGASSQRITHYEVRAMTSAGTSRWERIPDGTANYEYTALELTNGEQYTFEVRSVNDNGTPNNPDDDAYSDTVSATATPLEPPPPPVNVRAIPDDGQVTLHWDPPHLPEGVVLSHYEAATYYSDGVRTGDVLVVPADETTATIRGLTNGERYLFVVRSVNDNGTPGEYSDDVYSDEARVEAAPIAIVTRIGFLDRSATLFEGGIVRALLVTSGEPVDPALEPLDLKLEIESDAPRDRFAWERYFGRPGIYVLSIQSIPDAETGSPATYDFTLVEADEGLPTGIGLDHDRKVFEVTLRDIEPEDCSDLALTASRVRSRGLQGSYERNEVFSWGSAEIRFQGPQRAALRIREPYFWPGENPALAVINPTRLPYQEFGGGAHRQAVSLNWFNDLHLTAFLPGCREVSLEE